MQIIPSSIFIFLKIGIIHYLGKSVWVPLWHGWGRQETPLVAINGLQPTDLFFIAGGSGNFTMVSLVVRVITWGGGGGGACCCIVVDWIVVAGNWVAGMGWVGSISGRAGGSPAPANDETDWITGMESAIEVLDEMLIGRIELWVAAGLFKDDFGVLEKSRYIIYQFFTI